MTGSAAAARVERLGAAAIAWATANTPEALSELTAALAETTASDLGLAPAGPASPQPDLGSRLAALVRRGPEVVRYVPLFDGDPRGAPATCFDAGVFVLPAGASIPLHNHPGMTVLSRLLFGTLHVRSLDCADSAGGEATLAFDGELTGPAPPLVLTGSSRNVHCLTARTECAVLDVLSPPYDSPAGRGCTYYSEAKLVLRRIPAPKTFVVRRAPYTGPPLLPR